ncbi:MAG: translation factor Sua5, partial [Acetobacter sp.]|nr:translation factor Sua5 [Acetobacter sp.]
APLVWNLSAAGNLEEAAARLFTGLRTLDREGQTLGLRRIAVQPIPQHGLGRAIQDRLNRAAAPRPQDGTEDMAP